jgi:hypothetical protein
MANAASFAASQITLIRTALGLNPSLSLAVRTCLRQDNSQEKMRLLPAIRQ